MSEQVAEKSGTEVLKDLTPKQRQTWRATGELPESKLATPAPEPSKKPPKEPEPSPAPAPAPVPVEDKPAVEAAKTSRNKDAETRITELLTENKKLQSELETLRKIPVSTAPKGDEPAKPGRNDLDPKTNQPLYATDEEYLDARDKYVAESASRKARADIAKEQNDARVAEQNKIIEKRLQNSLTIAQERHPDFAEVLKAETKDGKTSFKAEAVQRIKSNGVLDGWILDSEIGAEILYHLAKNPAEVDRIQALSPFSAARELTKLEEKLAAGEAKPPEKKEEPASAAKPVVVPPAPASSVGGKATAPVDEEAAAIADGDFRRYKKTADAEEHRRKGVVN